MPKEQLELICTIIDMKIIAGTPIRALTDILDSAGIERSHRQLLQYETFAADYVRIRTGYLEDKANLKASVQKPFNHARVGRNLAIGALVGGLNSFLGAGKPEDGALFTGLVSALITVYDEYKQYGMSFREGFYWFFVTSILNGGVTQLIQQNIGLDKLPYLYAAISCFGQLRKAKPRLSEQQVRYQLMELEKRFIFDKNTYIEDTLQQISSDYSPCSSNPMPR